MKMNNSNNNAKQSSVFLKHTSCDACGSSDGNSLYSDGHTYCHVCHTYAHGDDDEDTSLKRYNSSKGKIVYMTQPVEQQGQFKSMPDRGITLATCEKFGVTQDESKHYYPYADSEGTRVAYKVRTVGSKEFSIRGSFGSATLFGQHLFHSGGKYLTIYEGELDALAGYQLTGSQWPSVSIRNGAQAALKDCKAQYDWINSFESVVICFDADEPGTKAAKEVAELFGSKAKIVKHLNGYKDACDYLSTGATKEFVNAWWRAEAFKPDGIVNGNELWDALKKPQQKPDAAWPYKDLDAMLSGLRKRELITIAAGTGQGKSTFLRQLIHHLLTTTNDNIGMAFLEESPQRTALGIMSIEAKKPLHLPTTVYTEDELKDAYDATMGTGRCVLFNHFGSLDIDNVLNRLRFMVKAQNCSWLILDHYQMILSGMDTDERKGLDMLLTKLRTFVEETGVGLFGVSHTKRLDGKGLENGAEITLSALRGTQGISQLSDAVIGLQRDQQHEDAKVRNTTELRVLKSRFTGETGPAGKLYFDKGLNKLVELEEETL
jgi:twinkle protein